MGATRKLQGEIDRVLKKVQEGVDVFDSIWNKVYDTENANQKEKFEADLKKEIKKLQRYRDQIKTWIQSSEIKDKKVAASYEQALLDARKLIEREMERFKVCEKETKTKAFSKEGLGQQPKTDPREKAKSETREWLNNMVSDLESQIDSFEAEMEGLFVKKGKSRPPRLTHLEESIQRHKLHIMKLELILRLLDNDELSPEQVNDVKDFVEDYVERNQDDFDDFTDVDDTYSQLPLDKIEALETMDALPTITPSIVVKEKVAIAVGNGVTSKPAVVASPTPQVVNASGLISIITSSTTVTSLSVQPTDEGTNSEASSETSARASPVPVIGGTSSATAGINSSVISSVSTVPASEPPSLPSTPVLGQRPVVNPPGLLPGNPSSRSLNAALNSPTSVPKETANLRRTGVGEGVLPRGIVRSSIPATLGMGQSSPLVSLGIGSSMSGSGIASTSGSSSVPIVSEISKRSGLGGDDRVLGQPGQPLTNMSMPNRIFMSPAGKVGEASDATGSSEGSGLIGSRLFPSTTGGQWRPPSASAFQNAGESGTYRTEIAPDQKQRFLQRLQQVHQQGHGSALLNAAAATQLSHLSSANQKQSGLSSSQLQQAQLQLLQQHQQHSNLIQSSQPTSIPQAQAQAQAQAQPQAQPQPQSQPQPQQAPPQQQAQAVGLTMGLPSSSVSVAVQGPQQQLPTSQAVPQQMQQVLPPAAPPKDNDMVLGRVTEPQPQSQQQRIADDGNTDSASLNAAFTRKVSLSEDDLKNVDTFEVSVGGPGTLAELSQLSREVDFTPGQQVVQPSPSTSGPGVIGRRSAGELGAIGENFTTHDQTYNQQMLEAAFRNIPLAKDSERPRSYIPRNPAVTPASYPQVPAPIIDNPALWERLDTDVLFFAFYYQQGTYQQYLAARELKKQSWRYHKKYNTWFQRHEEPKVTTDEFEQGTYVYFDFHIVDDYQQGWCQRIKTEFTFEYSYLEDELVA